MILFTDNHHVDYKFEELEVRAGNGVTLLFDGEVTLEVESGEVVSIDSIELTGYWKPCGDRVEINRYVSSERVAKAIPGFKRLALPEFERLYRDGYIDDTYYCEGEDKDRAE